MPIDLNNHQAFVAIVWMGTGEDLFFPKLVLSEDPMRCELVAHPLWVLSECWSCWALLLNLFRVLPPRWP